MAMLGQFPARHLIRGWLKAGVIDPGRFAPTEEGTPQGGVITPLLLNVAVHGLEHAAGCPRLGGLLPGGDILDDVLVIGSLHVAADLHMGEAQSWRQVEALGRGPVLRQVPPVPA
ncbi:hypothetical protein [Streptomyces noursei]|uniref:hypothetical protein n=1 Tax=Streptomyces noursei TaxID=1971 RepID=UPI0023B85BD1|nr:hypothetical protein [Streptomyces noursei]